MFERGDELDQATGIIRVAVGEGHIPGAVAAAGKGLTALATWVTGQADTTPGSARPMRTDTLFDLASLTKVVGTTTAILALASRDGIGLDDIGLDDTAGRYLPRFGALREVTIRQLLTHTSGLPDTRKFYQWCSTREELTRDLFATPLEASPGTRVTYSDLGFMALGEIVAAVAGQPLDAAVRRLVTEPLGMTSTGFTPAAPPERFAATERQADGTPWTGIVHDENARLMGGVAGHAGLFATVGDLATFAAWWAGGDDGPVAASLRREAETCQTAGLSGCRGLGWVCQGDRFDILSGPSSVSGASGVPGASGTPGHWPPTAVSHTGFTGTSLALDHPSGVWVVLLTNAVHFGRDATAVKALRRDLHAAVAAALLPDSQ
jgi:CubicO group peptidase (beta-lactamase class C family)